jgi:hypothetical protein
MTSSLVERAVEKPFESFSWKEAFTHFEGGKLATLSEMLEHIVATPDGRSYTPRTLLIIRNGQAGIIENYATLLALSKTLRQEGKYTTVTDTHIPFERNVPLFEAGKVLRSDTDPDGVNTIYQALFDRDISSESPVEIFLPHTQSYVGKLSAKVDVVMGFGGHNELVDGKPMVQLFARQNMHNLSGYCTPSPNRSTYQPPQRRTSVVVRY